MLHRFTQLVAAGAFLLLVAGSLVAGTGLIFYEQVHRVFGMLVGLLTIALVIAYWSLEPRGWVKRLAALALFAVGLQGLLGAVNMRWGLPPALSTTHSGLGAVFFVMIVALALFTSRSWVQNDTSASYAGDLTLRRLGVASIILVYLQILLGAVMRHTGAALAIPDYPLAFGRVLPPLDALATGPVAVHFLHRLGAVAVSIALGATIWRIATRYRDRAELMRPAMALVLLLALEVLLGAAAVVASPAGGWLFVTVTSALVGIGALIFATTVTLALRMHRPFFGAGIARA